MDEDFHGSSNSDGHLVGAPQSQGLRHQLAEEHMEVGNEGEGQRHGDQVRIEPRVRQWAQGLLENAGNGRFADPAQGQAAERYAELNSGKKIAEVLLQTADDAGSRLALRDELLD